MSVINRRSFIQFSGLSCLSIATQGALANSAPKKRPNIVLVLTDDQGYGDFGATGNPLIQTPNIDAMAKRSASMSHFYVSPVCSPTRACLMTGRYNYRTRCIDTYIGRSMMEPQEITVAEILRDAGYATGIFGKWHLGDHYPMRPMEQGFEKAVVLQGGGIGQPSDPPGAEGKYTDPILLENGKAVQKKGYCTDIYFDEALLWIQECQAQNRPFLTYIATNAPHSPLEDVPPEDYKEFQSKDLSNSQFPQEKGHPLPEKNNQDQRARIYAMIRNIDKNMGKLFEELNRLGLTDDTMVLFLVDNGPNERRYVSGMRGMKSEVYEGGIRSPLFAHWPGVFQSGHSSDRIAAHIDLMPTILEACGASIPQDVKVDGRSILPLLKGEAVDWADRTIFIQSHRGDQPVLYHNFAARSQDWKLLHASGFGKETFEGEPKFELYDMKNDPLETREVSAERSEIVRKMREDYEAWFDDVSHTRENNYAPPRISIGSPHENPTILTRQDWRHVKGGPWATDSNGYWELYVEQNADFDIRLRFPQENRKWSVTIEIGDKNMSQEVDENKAECLLTKISLEKGNIRLMATLNSKEISKGPWQVDVIRR